MATRYSRTTSTVWGQLTGRKDFCINAFHGDYRLDGRRPTMDPRFQQRKNELLADCQVSPTSCRGAMKRWETFAQPFVATLPRPEGQEYSRISISGPLS